MVVVFIIIVSLLFFLKLVFVFQTKQHNINNSLNHHSQVLRFLQWVLQ